MISCHSCISSFCCKFELTYSFKASLSTKLVPVDECNFTSKFGKLMNIDILMYTFSTSFSSLVDRLLLWMWVINFQCWRCFWSWFWFWSFRKRHKPSPEASSLPSMLQPTSGVVRIMKFYIVQISIETFFGGENDLILQSSTVVNCQRRNAKFWVLKMICNGFLGHF